MKKPPHTECIKCRGPVAVVTVWDTVTYRGVTEPFESELYRCEACGPEADLVVGPQMASMFDAMAALKARVDAGERAAGEAEGKL